MSRDIFKSKSKKALASALSAVLADVISTLLLFPLDVIKLRLQAGDSVAELVRFLETHPREVYRGVKSKVVQSAQQKFQYFYVNAILKEAFVRKFQAKPSTGPDLLLGYISALQGLGTTLPLEVTNTRIITTKKSHKDEKMPGFRATFAEIVRKKGFFSFYRTIFASAVLCLNPALTFVIFEELKGRILQNSSEEVLTTIQALLIGVVSKSIAAIITFPFTRAKVLMSIWHKKEIERLRTQGFFSSNEDSINVETPGLLETMKQVVNSDGVLALYAGLGPQLVKGVLNASLMLAIKEKVYLTLSRAVGASKVSI